MLVFPGYFARNKRAACGAQLTKVLHILVGDELERAALALTALGASTVAFEDHDAVSDGSGKESGAVGETGPAAGGVEGDVAQAVAQGAEQQGHVAGEPRELESLRERDKALLRGLARRRRSHCSGLSGRSVCSFVRAVDA